MTDNEVEIEQRSKYQYEEAVLTGEPATTFDVGPGLLNFGSLPGPQGNISTGLQVLLTNNGSNEVVWKATVGYGGAPGWLKLRQNFGYQLTGTIPAHAQQPIDVMADISGLGVGQHHAILHFTSEQGSKDVAVSLTVRPSEFDPVNRGGPKIKPGTLSFSAKTKSLQQNVQLTNTNTLNLNWQATIPPGATWLHVTPSVGVVNAGQTVDINVSAQSSGLKAGTYTAKVVFSWEPPSGSSAQATVTLVV